MVIYDLGSVTTLSGDSWLLTCKLASVELLYACCYRTAVAQQDVGLYARVVHRVSNVFGSRQPVHVRDGRPIRKFGIRHCLPRTVACRAYRQ